MPPARLFEHAHESGWIPVRCEQIPGAEHYIAIFVQENLFTSR